jgi:mRNA-degrading endonuclease RelE of RelBE toxin-antitoxin system
MDKRIVKFAPRAERDWLKLPRRDAERILDDLALLESPPRPAGKIKPLRGCSYWEIKTGDYRSLFLPVGKEAIILRVVHRRDLERAVKQINPAAVALWIRQFQKSD